MKTVNLSSSYKNFSVQLILEGLSCYGKENDLITSDAYIITKWSLTIGDQPRLEGSAHQLVNLVQSVNDYAVHIMDPMKTPSEMNTGAVEIQRQGMNHEIVIHDGGKQGNIYLRLDDSQLLDLVLCIDDLLIKDQQFSRLDFPLHHSHTKENFLGRFLYPFVAPALSAIMLAMGTWFCLTLPLARISNVNTRFTNSQVVCSI